MALDINAKGLNINAALDRCVVACSCAPSFKCKGNVLMIDLIETRNERLERINELMILTKTTKQDFLNLGFTEAQIGGWFAKAGSVRARSPSALQLTKIWHAFDWSPTYVVFGKGAKLLSQVGIHEDMFERMDRFQAVLQLALDEAEANKKRYRGALKTIEDRDQQIVDNKQTLADFGVSLAAADKNVSSLSKKLDQVLEQLGNSYTKNENKNTCVRKKYYLS